MAAAPAAGILAMFEMLMVSIVALMLFEWLVHSMVGWIPFVGNRAAAAASSVSQYVQNKVEGWLYPQLHTLLHWFEVLAARVLDFPHSVVDALSDVEGAVDYLVRTKIPQMVRAMTHQLSLDVHYLTSTLPGVISDVERIPAMVDHKVASYGHALSDTLLDIFRRGIDRLERDVIRPADQAIRDSVKTLDRTLSRDIKAARDIARGAEHDLADLADRIGVPLSVIEALVAAIGVTAAIEAVETLGRCHPKLKVMCTSDPAQWARLIEGLLVLAAWPGLREVAKDAAAILESRLPDLRDIIINGGS